MDTQTDRRNFLGGTGVIAAGAFGAGLAAGAVAEAQVAAPAPPPASKAATLKALVNKGDHFDVPFIPDVVSSRLCEMLGFPAVFTGGYWGSASRYGIPDFGLISITELIKFGADIAEYTSLPVLSDGDDAGGSANNAYRATRGFEKAGVVGVMYEDTTQVKNMVSGHGNLVTQDEMVDKIKATVDARIDPNFLLIARTDALSVGHSMDEAMARGIAYAEAGADVLFFGGLKLEDHARVRGIVKLPLMTNPAVTVPAAQVQAAKVTIAFRHFEPIGAGAIYQAMQELKNTGMLAQAAKMTLPEDVEERLLQTPDWMARAGRYHLMPK